MTLNDRKQKQLALYLYGVLDSLQHGFEQPEDIRDSIDKFESLSEIAKTSITNVYDKEDKARLDHWVNSPSISKVPPRKVLNKSEYEDCYSKKGCRP